MWKKGALFAFGLYVAVSLAEGVSRALFGRENSLLEMIWHHCVRHVAAFFYAAGDLLMFVIRHVHLEEFAFSFWDTLSLLGRVALIPYDFFAGMVGLSFLEYNIGDFIPGFGAIMRFSPVLMCFAAILGYLVSTFVLKQYEKMQVAPAEPAAPVEQAEPAESPAPPKRGRKAKTSD